ncbi:MAG: hypothetical protein M3R08_00525 [Bacteroidota bacterium]|nr:hypothetical protein [Bacteroidota bacterium]
MNERIDHTNYEAWLLDRLEGNLSSDQEAELNAFLASNPDLVPIEHDLPSISAASLPSFDKASLKRSFPPQGNVSSASIDDHLIARLEGDLTSDQKLALGKFLYEHPEHANADRLYALTKLVPQAMAFVAKQDLERQLPPEGLVTKYTLQDHLVARLEGDLSDRQEAALEAYLKRDLQAEHAWQIMSRTKISADPVIYPQKSGLKKGGRVIAISFQRAAIRYAAAASVAVLLGLALWSVLESPDRNSGTTLVENATPEKIEMKESTTEAKVDQDGTPVVDGSSKPIASADNEEPLIASVADRLPSTNSSQNSSRNSSNTNSAPVERSIDRESPQFAEQRKVVPAFDRPEAEPIAVQVAEVPVNFDQEQLSESKVQEERGNSIGALVASAVREKVLEQPSEEPRPLDQNDAVAAVDKGLKAISGQKAGLDVQRTKGGKIRNFNLRVGEFALTASTGN